MTRLDERTITLIEDLRNAGLSVRDVAARVGVGHGTVSQLAPGVRAPNPTHFSPETVERIKVLRADGYTGSEVAEMVGCSPGAVRKRVPGRPGKVPVAPLREAFLASPVTAADVARELGWCWGGRHWRADSSRVKRTLGLLPDISGCGRRSYRTLVDAEIVQLIAEAIGVAPWSVMPADDLVDAG